MILFARGALLAVLAALSLTSCGGGGSNVSGSNVFIASTINRGMWSVAGGGTQLQDFAVAVVATSTYDGPDIIDAEVTINGTQLAYNTSSGRFEGFVVADGAGKFVLTVVANGETHTATATAMTSLPVITVPSPFYAAQDNTILWSPVGGVVAGFTPLSYRIEVINPSDYGATRIAYTTSTSGLSATVPAGSTNSYTTYYISLSALYIAADIASAASGSNFALYAFTSISNINPL